MNVDGALWKANPQKPNQPSMEHFVLVKIQKDDESSTLWTNYV